MEEDNINFKGEKIMLLFLLFLMVCVIVMGVYGAYLERRYIECASKFNNCSRSCISVPIRKFSTPTVNISEWDRFVKNTT